MIKPNRVLRKREIHENGSNRGKTFKNENKKETCSKTHE